MNRGNAGVIGTLVTPSTSVATGVFSLNQLQVAAKNGTWPPFAVPDPYFDFVTMLLPGNGTDGAQNNTFLDSSTNNFTITRNGNTTQGTFAPYGNLWSNFFDTSGDSLTVPYSSTLALGTGNCTIEAWVFFASYPQQFSNIIDVREASDNYSNNAISFGVENNGTFVLYAGSYSGASPVLQTASGKVPLNTWVHLALARSSGTTVLYVNGVQEASSANAWNQTSGTATTLYIGNAVVARQVNGYISNVRIVKGTAVYTSAFTPPTSPLTAITNTVLLTCQNNRFIDNSTNNFTITRNGDVSIQRFSPFNPTASYAPSIDGGSGYFDGAGDYLISPVNAALAFGSSDFCIEFWIYTTSFSSTDGRPLGNAVAWGANVWSLHNDHASQNEKFSFWVNNYNASVAMLVSTSSTQLNTWQHVAITRSGSTWRMFVNGVIEATQTSSVAIDGGSSDDLFIGGSGNFNEFIAGYFSGLRLVKGTAVYTANFTPPTAPPTAITNTSLLLNFTNAGILDNAEMNNLETVGNAQISTAQSKFGSGSIAFDGNGDYLISAPRNSNEIGSGDFTIECWIYPNNTTSAYRPIVASNNYAATGGGWILYQNGTSLELWLSPGISITLGATSAITASVWQHIALSRSSGTLRIFVNGTSVASVANTATFTGNNIYVGSSAGLLYFNGYIDDLRITKGYARYTANFTPPVLPFPTA